MRSHLVKHSVFLQQKWRQRLTEFYWLYIWTLIKWKNSSICYQTQLITEKKENQLRHGLIFLQHQTKIAEFMKKKVVNDWKKDWRRSETAEWPRSKEITCQSCRICEVTKHLICWGNGGTRSRLSKKIGLWHIVNYATANLGYVIYDWYLMIFREQMHELQA